MCVCVCACVGALVEEKVLVESYPGMSPWVGHWGTRGERKEAG